MVLQPDGIGRKERNRQEDKKKGNCPHKKGDKKKDMKVHTKKLTAGFLQKSNNFWAVAIWLPLPVVLSMTNAILTIDVFLGSISR